MSPQKKKNSGNDSKEPNPAQTTGSAESSPSLETESANGSRTIPRPNLLSKEQVQNRKLQALKRLKVSPDQVEKAPPISEMLKKSKGGLRGLLKAMRFATEDDEIRTFLEKYDSINPGDRQYLPWEAIAIAAEVNLKYLLGAVQLAAVQYFGNMSKIIAISNHPKITTARVKYALDPSGERDRQSLDIMVGALPSPKGPTFIGQAVFGASVKSGSHDDDEDDTPRAFGGDDDIDILFPPARDMQHKIQSVRQKQIEAPK